MPVIRPMHSKLVGHLQLTLAPSWSKVWTRNLSRTASIFSADKIDTRVDHHGIRRIVINRPEAKNALSFEMMGQLGTVLRESNTDTLTKLITITGAGDFFSSGNDLNNWRKGTLEEVQAKTRKYVLNQLMYGFLETTKPIIALVNGGAIGAGCTLLPFCDLVIASDKAFFHTPFPSLHIVPEFCSSYLFPKIMGLQRANNMLLFGHKMTAKEALDWGFVNFMFPASEFEEKCEQIVDQARKIPLKPMMKSKDVIRNADRDMLRHLCCYEMDLVMDATSDPELQANLKRFFSRKGGNADEEQ